MDTLGNILDSWIYDGGNNLDTGQDFKSTKDGGFIIGGNSRSYTADNNSDFLMIKIDSIGVFNVLIYN